MTPFLHTKDFDGAVILVDWVNDPISGRKFIGVAGRVTIASAKEAAGFEPASSESNWIARVQGPTTSYNFPGCKVRAVVERHGVPIDPPPSSDVLRAE